MKPPQKRNKHIIKLIQKYLEGSEYNLELIPRFEVGNRPMLKVENGGSAGWGTTRPKVILEVIGDFVGPLKADDQCPEVPMIIKSDGLLGVYENNRETLHVEYTTPTYKPNIEPRKK